MVETSDSLEDVHVMSRCHVCALESPDYDVSLLPAQFCSDVVFTSGDELDLK